MKVAHPIYGIILHYLAILAGSMAFTWLIKHVGILQAIDSFLFGLLFATTAGDIRGVVTTLFDHSLRVLPITIPTFYFFFIGLPVVYLLTQNKKKDALALFLLYVVCWGAAALIFWVDWQILFRERPLAVFLDLPDIFQVRGWQHLPSHPSGHATGTAIIATLVTYFIPALRWPSFICVVIAALSRVYLGAHFPLDVLAGIVLGYYIGLLGVRIYETQQSFFKK